MKLDGFGLMVNDMGTMIRFYRDVLGFEIKEAEDADNVYLIKDGTRLLQPTLSAVRPETAAAAFHAYPCFSTA